MKFRTHVEPGSRPEKLRRAPKCGRGSRWTEDGPGTDEPWPLTWTSLPPVTRPHARPLVTFVSSRSVILVTSESPDDVDKEVDLDESGYQNSHLSRQRHSSGKDAVHQALGRRALRGCPLLCRLSCWRPGDRLGSQRPQAGNDGLLARRRH